MLNINNIGADAMIRTRDHKTPYLIDPWDYLGPKRRTLLDESWAGLFREHILSELPVHEIASCYTDGFGRPIDVPSKTERSIIICVLTSRP